MPDQSTRKPKRDQLFTMKATAEELSTWKAIAKSYDTTLSQLVRDLLSGTKPNPNHRPIRHRPPPKIDPEAMRKLSGISNNMNQIARRCNQGKRVNILAALQVIEDEIEELIDALQSHKPREG